MKAIIGLVLIVLALASVVTCDAEVAKRDMVDISVEIFLWVLGIIIKLAIRTILNPWFLFVTTAALFVEFFINQYISSEHVERQDFVLDYNESANAANRKAIAHLTTFPSIRKLGGRFVKEHAKGIYQKAHSYLKSDPHKSKSSKSSNDESNNSEDSDLHSTSTTPYSKIYGEKDE